MKFKTVLLLGAMVASAPMHAQRCHNGPLYLAAIHATASSIIDVESKQLDADGNPGSYFSNHGETNHLLFPCTPPNPTAEILRIQLPATRADQLNIQVFDLEGIVVLKKYLPIYPKTTETELIIRHLPPGRYRVQVQAGNEQFAGFFHISYLEQ